MKQILSNEIIFDVLIGSSNLLHKSIISFLFTTGLKHDMIRNLKIKDLLSSCSKYMDGGESIDDLLDKNPFDIVPCWRISNESNVGITFNTPETTKYLFDYLKDRIKYVNLTEESYLFKNYNKNSSSIDKEPLEKNYITKELARKKHKLNSFHNGDEILFNADNIRYTFTKTCEEHLPLQDSDKNELIKLFTCVANKNNKFYKKFNEDNESILKYYEHLSPYLNIDYDLTGHADNSSVNECYSDLDVWAIVKKYFYECSIKYNFHPDYDNILKWTYIAFNIAKKDNKKFIFENSNEYLDKLYKKTYLRIFFEDIDINIVLKTEFDYQDAVVDVADILDEHGFFEKFDVDIADFKSIFMDIIECSNCSKIDTNVVITSIESAYYLNDNFKLVEEDIF